MMFGVIWVPTAMDRLTVRKRVYRECESGTVNAAFTSLWRTTHMKYNHKMCSSSQVMNIM